MYISEWTSGGMELSNIRVTTKVAVNALLGDTPALREYGTAIMHNLGTKEVKAVVRVRFLRVYLPVPGVLPKMPRNHHEVQIVLY